MNPALILDTVAKLSDGFANRLFTMIGVTTEPSETPAVVIDIAATRFLSKYCDMIANEGT
jgi:hypothetical protein